MCTIPWLGGPGKGGKGNPTRWLAPSGPPSPALLTSYIKRAWTIDALFDTYLKHGKQFNHIHLSACWNSLGRLAQSKDSYRPQVHAESLGSLMRHTTNVVSTTNEITARELATIAHGVAKTGKGGTMSTLMNALACAIQIRMDACNAQEIANVAWAFAKVGDSTPSFFNALAIAAERRLDEFKPQELSNTVHAFAKAGCTSPTLFDAIATCTVKQLSGFTPQGIANTVWAFASAGHSAPALFDAIAGASAHRMYEFNAQDLANTVYAFGKAGHPSPALFDAVATAAMRQLHEFTPQGLTNTVWAYATVGHTCPLLFDAVAASAGSRLHGFDPQALANTAWSYAKACHLHAQLFTQLATAAAGCLNAFNAQDLVNTVWAFAKVGHRDESLLTGMAISAAKLVGSIGVQDLANVAWAFAKLGHMDSALFAALARSAEQRLADFDAHNLANVAWGFANAGQIDAQLFAALGHVAQKVIAEFTDEDLDNAEWAFAKAGQRQITRLLREHKKRMPQASGCISAVDRAAFGRVVVAGGGIGGAAVAVALQRRGFDVLVLEADRSFDARKQGYGLTIQRQDAMQAMGINLTQDDAPSTSHYTFSADGQILGFFGEAFGASRTRRESTNSGRFIHIPRQVLRSRMLDELQPGTVRWNARLKSFSCWDGASTGRREPGGVTVTLMDGTTLDAALLVGSDGIFSSVRRQLHLPGDRLHYVGLVVVLGIMDGETPKLTERRIFETVDGTTRIYAMPFTTCSTMWQLSFPYPEDAVLALVKDTAALKVEILRRCGEWHAPIPDLLRSTPLHGMSGYPVYDREPLNPRILRPEAKEGAVLTPQRRVTLIGDAAHPMTPFKAQGANQALSDAVLFADCLANGIARHGVSTGMDIALPLFEQTMLQRAAKVVTGSREKAKELHSALALQPARKVQREADGVDMQRVIQVLRQDGVGAHSAVDPRGLDALVLESIEKTKVLKDAARPSKRRRTHVAQPSIADADMNNVATATVMDGAAPDWGFNWQGVTCQSLVLASGGGLRRKQLRKAVLKLYLRHISAHSEAETARRWWKSHQLELRARFRMHLRNARANGHLRTEGKMVCRL